MLGGSRLVVDGANNVDSVDTAEDTNKNIKGVADELKRGKRYPELIAVHGDCEDIILVEGHTRATRQTRYRSACT